MNRFSIPTTKIILTVNNCLLYHEKIMILLTFYRNVISLRNCSCTDYSGSHCLSILSAAEIRVQFVYYDTQSTVFCIIFRQLSFTILTLISIQLSRLPSGASPLLCSITVFLWDSQPLHFLYYPLTHPYILLHTHQLPPPRGDMRSTMENRVVWEMIAIYNCLTPYPSTSHYLSFSLSLTNTH